MSSWQGRPPSPTYRQRRYSPSREVSPPPPTSARAPLPPTRSDMNRPMRTGHYSPPPSAGGDRYAPRPRSRSPPPRYRDHGRRSPSPRYRDHRDDERYRASPPPPSRRNRPGASDFYDEPLPPPPPPRDRDRYDDRTRGGMAADWEEDRAREMPPPRHERVRDQWERGYEPGYGDESYGHNGDRFQADARQQDDRSVKRGGRPPSVPYRDVIFLGLDDELTEADFSGFLTSEHQAQLSSVKIVRDRETGNSRNFGFAQFVTLDDAQDFVYNNYPYIQMPALYAHSEARRVKIDFSAPAHGHNAADHNQGAELAPSQRHDGTQDMGSAGGGNRVLLLRMLDWNTRGEVLIHRLSQEIARMLGKQGREHEAAQAIVRAATIHDMVGRNASWGFAFVELVTAELATALLSFLLSRESQPQGFLIADRPIGASFASSSAFVPFPAGPLGGEFLLRASRNGGIGSDAVDKPDGQWVAYNHEHAGAIEAVPKGAHPIHDDGLLPAMSAEVRMLLGSLAGRLPGTAESSTSTPAPPSAGMVTISNVMQPIKIGAPIAMPKVTRKADEAGFVTQDRRNILGDDDEEQDLVGKDTVLLSRTKGAHIVPPTSGSRKIAKNISKWNTKQSELAAPVPAPVSTAGPSNGGGPPKGISSANATLGLPQPKHSAREPAAAQASSSSSSGPQKQTQSASPSPAPVSASPIATADDFDYSGPPQADGKVACLLCQRLLPNPETLRKHVATSGLHKTNLANSDTVASGRQRKQNASAPISTPGEAEAEAPKYRDRAAERREVFHQPEKPSYMDRIALSKGAASAIGPPKRKFAEGPKAPSPPPEPGLAPGQDESNKGNALLTKMGWAAGTGLGKGSEGRVDPVQVKLLQERAGLGAGSKK